MRRPACATVRPHATALRRTHATEGDTTTRSLQPLETPLHVNTPSSPRLRHRALGKQRDCYLLRDEGRMAPVCGCFFYSRTQTGITGRGMHAGGVTFHGMAVMLPPPRTTQPPPILRHAPPVQPPLQLRTPPSQPPMSRPSPRHRALATIAIATMSHTSARELFFSYTPKYTPTHESSPASHRQSRVLPRTYTRFARLGNPSVS